MLRWLGQALKEAREEAHLGQWDVIDLVPPKRGKRSHASRISDFENGKAWPHDVDAVIEAYAKATRRTAFELWARALTQWAASDGAGSEEARVIAARLLDEVGGPPPGLPEAATHAASHEPNRPKSRRGRPPRS
jgi:hypothetical protein